MSSEETAAARAARAEPRTRSRPIDVLAIGETMALVTPARPEPLESARDFYVGTGGAESNVACHLASAGRAVEWFSALGDDPLGRRVGAFIEASGVSIARVRHDPDAPTGLYVKDPGRGVSYYRKGSAASRLGPGDLSAIDATQVRIVHLSGITLACPRAAGTSWALRSTARMRAERS
ncbi:PfkB family carbohydrate kinase [Brachybacterium sp. NPDC056505]|uniref:PfkB family carbohydrate kinase n=1 Tax=Brachybacterium sp. NPDC056505 TaxID=3345843 RepID=UPI003671CF28